MPGALPALLRLTNHTTSIKAVMDGADLSNSLYTGPALARYLLYTPHIGSSLGNSLKDFSHFMDLG